MTGDLAGPVTGSGSGSGSGTVGAAAKRTSYLELFFDLVFVFAITQLAGMLHADHSGRGWVRAGLMAWLIWWAWSQYTWAGNAIDLERRPVRVALLAVTGTTLVAAIAIPAAYSGNGAWFAVPYVAVRLAGLALYWAGLRDDPEHRAALRTYVPVACVSPLLVLAGGLADGDVRPWLWLLAVAVDLASVAAAGRGEFRIAPGHFAERHALIVIVALGESVIAVGATATDLPLDGPLVATAAVGFLIVAALWWAYFDWVQEATEARLVHTTDHRARSNLARDLYTLAHFPIVAGTVVFAVGVEEAVVHPTDPLPTFGRVAVGLGLALFLGGFVVGGARATGRLLPERAAALVGVVLVVVALGASVAAVWVLVAVALVLGTAEAAETVRRARAG